MVDQKMKKVQQGLVSYTGPVTTI